ncbi:MAG TPA: aldolase/citrate lyase family protein [Spirochaetia bacterium]|nr:aldolase/citrate lyase family protein [Spirochaetia bacterium]
MKPKNKVKEKIVKGVPTFGSWIMIGHLASAEILAQAGFDWITVDMEHTAIDYNTLQVLLAGIRSHGAEGFVRIEDNNPVVIKRVLDCGANGIIVPLVNTREEAERAVQAARYPPEGFRGVSLGRASGYGDNFDDYFHSANREIVVIAQIEHYIAVENIESIVSVEGLDGVFLGPYDLSGSMNIVAQFDHPKMKDARRKVKEATLKAGKALGFHEVRPEADGVKALLEEGFNFIACSIDTLFLSSASKRLMQSIVENQTS